MSWVTLIWGMIASACLTLAMVHLLVWLQRRNQWAHLLFSLVAAGNACYAIAEAWVMRAESVEEFGLIVRWAHLPFWVLMLSLVGFVRIYLRAGRLWLAWTICGLRTLALILNFIFTPNINFREITSLRHIQFLGEPVSVAVGVPNPWMLIGQLSLVLLLVFLVDATITIWRRGERRSMVMLSSIMAFFIAVSLALYVLNFWGIRPMPYMASLCFLGVVAVMSWETSRETIRAVQLTEDLSKTEGWLDLAADSAEVGPWLWDFTTNQIWATERCRKLYGFSPDEAIPFEKFLARLHPEDRDWVVTATQKCKREGFDFRHDYRIVLPDGKVRWIKVLAKVLALPSGEPERMTGVSIDITERKQAEDDLAQQSGKLSHLLRVSTLSVLSVSLAHELKRPLGTILRNAEAAEMFLKAPSPDLEEVLAILEDIRADDLRAGELIDRMRQQLKRHETEHILLDMNQLADEVIRLVRQEADSRKVRLTLELDSSSPPVRGDRVQLQQVLLNLLLNAFDAVDDSTPEDRSVIVCVQANGLQVEVAVCDSGHGIPADTLESVFDPFFTTKPEGLGMGLAISRDIIEVHGGQIQAQNNEAGGATVSVSLPAALEGDTI